MPVPDENGSPYFDVVFGSSGDLTAVPDAVQPSGGISFVQGWGPFYAQDPTVNPATALFIDRAQTNQLFNYITQALQAYQQFGTPAFITSSMNGGSPFSYAQYARVVHGGVVYTSLVPANTDTPPTSKWTTSFGRTILTGNATYYVATTGNDANAGTSGSPWATLQHAYNTLQDALDLAGFTLTISVGDGSYSAGLTASGPFVGQTGASSVVIQGNTGTPDNCIISTSSGSNFSASYGASFSVTGFKLVNSSGSANAMSAAENGTILFSLVDFGAVSNGVHIDVGINSSIQAAGNYSISGGAQAHWAASANGGSIVVTGVTVTLTGTPNFSNQFAAMNHMGFVYCPSVTFTGSATGVRYVAVENSVISTGGGGASYLPGNSGGSTTSGGQYT